VSRELKVICSFSFLKGLADCQNDFFEKEVALSFEAAAQKWNSRTLTRRNEVGNSPFIALMNDQSRFSPNSIDKVRAPYKNR
jgi:hypothetical protein